jgi:hypothetical protein
MMRLENTYFRIKVMVEGIWCQFGDVPNERLAKILVGNLKGNPQVERIEVCKLVVTSEQPIIKWYRTVE